MPFLSAADNVPQTLKSSHLVRLVFHILLFILYDALPGTMPLLHYLADHVTHNDLMLCVISPCLPGPPYLSPLAPYA
jgi:hypothetical protein